MRSHPNSWNKTLTKLGFRRRANRGARKPNRFGRRPRFENLEQRQMLTGDMVTVDTLEDGVVIGATSLREALDFANDISSKTTILFDSKLAGGTIELDDSLGQLLIDSEVKIVGLGADLLTIDAGADSTNSHRVFQAISGIDVTIQGLTITGGYVGSATNGGGILSSAELTLQEVKIEGNEAGQSGGGLYSASGSVLIEGSTFENNTATFGGGARLDNGLITSISIEGSTFSNNTAGTGAGALIRGGDVNVTTEGTVSIENSTFSGNRGTGFSAGGLGIEWNDSNATPVQITNTTITDNTIGTVGATSSIGGGISISNADVVLKNGIVAGNAVISNSGQSTNDVSGPIDSASSHNAFGPGTASPNGTSNTILTQMQLDGLLQPLADNGGPTETHALSVGSFAIDAGANISGQNYDQRGFNRVVSLSLSGSTVDLGAYESGLVVSTGADEDDPDYSYGDLALREALDLAAAIPGVNEILVGTVATATSLTIDGELVIDSDVKILGSGADVVTIDAEQTDRVFNLNSGYEATIQGVSITGGLATGSGVDEKGGGIFSEGDLKLEEVVLTGNHADGSGGGLLMDGGSLTIVSSTIDGNTAQHGAGAELQTAGSGPVLIESSTFSNNVANSTGGGLTVWGGGGADGAVMIVNSTFAGNQATNLYGGGLHIDLQDSATIINSTFALNHAKTVGGGIRLSQSTTTLQNSIVAGNSIETASNSEIEIEGAFTSASNNLFGQHETNQLGVQTVLASGEIDDVFIDLNSSSDLDIADLGNYGGQIETLALAPTSKAIDIGSNSYVDDYKNDQRGLYHRRVQNSTVDVGAIEGNFIQDSSNGDIEVFGTDAADAYLVIDSNVYVYLDGNLRPTAGDYSVALPITLTSSSTITIHGFNGPDALQPFSVNGANSTIYGGPGDDLIDANNPTAAGDNTFHGGAGDDSLVGGGFRDTLYGDSGNDTLKGHAGDDHLEGGDGDDEIHGNDGDDHLEGDAGDDELFGDDGEDEIHGGYGADKIYGGDDDDEVHAGDGDDEIYGGDGGDRLLGGDDDDLLFGEKGDDFLYAGAGFDLLFEGEGTDYFHDGGLKSGYGGSVSGNADWVLNDPDYVLTLNNNLGDKSTLDWYIDWGDGSPVSTVASTSSSDTHAYTEISVDQPDYKYPIVAGRYATADDVWIVDESHGVKVLSDTLIEPQDVESFWVAEFGTVRLRWENFTGGLNIGVDDDLQIQVSENGLDNWDSVIGAGDYDLASDSTDNFLFGDEDPATDKGEYFEFYQARIYSKQYVRLRTVTDIGDMAEAVSAWAYHSLGSIQPVDTDFNNKGNATTAKLDLENVDTDSMGNLVGGIDTEPSNAIPRDDDAVKLSADVVLSGVGNEDATITLEWPDEYDLHWGDPTKAVEISGDYSFTVYRKKASESDWGLPVATFSGLMSSTAQVWEDPATLDADEVYEYRVERSGGPMGAATGYIAVSTGRSADAHEARGAVVLVIDERFSESLAFEIARLKQDLIGDGWQVIEEYVDIADEDYLDVKTKIQSAYDDSIADGDAANDVKSVFLLGHIPTPISGDAEPDGHDPFRNFGADVFYGDVEGHLDITNVWQNGPDKADYLRLNDLGYNYVPDDDPTSDPTGADDDPVELSVGRVDMNSLVAFDPLTQYDLDDLGGWQPYTIPVGESFTGDFDYMTFISMGTLEGSNVSTSRPVQFRDLKIISGNTEITVDFDDLTYDRAFGNTTLVEWGKDEASTVTPLSNLLTLDGRAWQVAKPKVGSELAKETGGIFRIGPDTVISFDLKISDEMTDPPNKPDVIAIGFDKHETPHTDSDGTFQIINREDSFRLFSQSNGGGHREWGRAIDPHLETELMRRYLNKDHAFRQGYLSVDRAAILNNSNAGERDSGLRNTSPMVGFDQVDFGPNWDNAGGDSYLWGQWSGSGHNTGISGVSNYSLARNTVNDEFRVVFAEMRGSYSWDQSQPDNLLRSFLAEEGLGLGNVWGGGGHESLGGAPQGNFQYFHMATGGTLGESYLITQNRDGLYVGDGNGKAEAWKTQLGDPTLRLHAVKPPTGVLLEDVAGGVKVTWTNSLDAAVDEYRVYRAAMHSDKYTLLATVAESLSGTTEYTDTDSTPTTSEYRYMLRAVKTETTPSGIYDNLSQGAFSDAFGVVYALNAGGASGAGNGTGFDFDADVSPEPAGVDYVTTGSSISLDYHSAGVPINIPEAIFQDARTGSNLTFMQGSLDANRQYAIKLYFAEIEAGFTAIGDRVFDVSINGRTVLKDYDIIERVGAEKTAVVESFMARPDANGDLEIKLTGVVDDALISAIEIVESVTVPTVVDVRLDGSGWTRSAYSLADRVENGEQLRSIGTDDVDTIEIEFSESVDLELSGDELKLLGKNGVEVTTTYTGISNNVATWTVTNLPDDKYAIHLSDETIFGVYGLRLDGDWTNDDNGTPDDFADDTARDFVVGNGLEGSAGGEFRFHFAYLVGDYDGDGEVTAADKNVTDADYGDGDGDGDAGDAQDDAKVNGALNNRLPLRTLFGADLHDDEIIDSFDEVKWINNLGTPMNVAWDIDGNGLYEAADDTLWNNENGSYSAWYQGKPFQGSGDAGAGGSVPVGAAPRVTNVVVSGSNSVHGHYSFDTVDGSGDQILTTTVGNADTVSITFSEPVNVVAESLDVVGLTTGRKLTLKSSASSEPLDRDGFVYDPLTRTATWRFDNWVSMDGNYLDNYLISLRDDVTDRAGNQLDGEWTNPTSISTVNSQISTFPSGDGKAGGTFNFVITILPGDADLDRVRDNVVNQDDTDAFIANLALTNPDFLESDFSGDGDLDLSDWNLLSSNNGKDLSTIAILADLHDIADSDVDADDVALVKTHFGTTNPLGDVNGDGTVDLTDLDLAFAQFGLEIDLVV